ncbi:MAG: hypothetical protein HYV60_16985 [Planctomycetia bacterium]|nr:hypothetical protein [Planctomycetia bacterium]
MNTFVLSVAYLAVAQLPPAQFSPGQTVSPVPPSQIIAEPSSESRGGTSRFSDQQPDVPAAQSPEPPSQLRPARNWSLPQEPQPVTPPAQSATFAQGESPVVPIHSTDLEALAAMILDGAIDMHTDEGTDIALVDLLRRVGDNSARQQAVQSYWRLCVAMAELNFARHEVRYLSELLRPQSQLEESLLTAEVTQARARQATAGLKVLELQEQLVDAGRLELTERPRPVDRPFVGPYATHFETLFADRTAPTHLKRIDGRLPHQLEVIERRAEAVAAGERAASQLAEAYENGAASLNHVLDSLAQLSRTRSELLAAVLSYNEQIAEYSFAVVRPGVPTESLLGTLIRREVAAQPTMLADSRVRRASAEAPVRESGEVDGSLPLRPTADPQDSPRSEPSALAPDSHSILKRATIDHP